VVAIDDDHVEKARKMRIDLPFSLPLSFMTDHARVRLILGEEKTNSLLDNVLWKD